MPLELSIVTPEGVVYEGEVNSVVLPGSEGDFGALPGHERFVCPVRIGQLEIQGRAGAERAAISGGFADVSASEVVVLADACELAPQIDVERAERARARAEDRLREGGAGVERDVDLARAERALSRALARLAAAGRR